MPDRLSAQAERFYEALSALVRAYQFRDRNSVTCHGLSVSQCYSLETLGREGPLPMSRLSGLLHLDVSTTTRVVDQLVSEELAVRVEDPHDRRVRRVRVTRRGRARLAKIRADLVREYRDLLEEVPAGSRDAVIETVSRLLAAFKSRAQRGCREREPAARA